MAKIAESESLCRENRQNRENTKNVASAHRNGKTGEIATTLILRKISRTLLTLLCAVEINDWVRSGLFDSTRTVWPYSEQSQIE